MGIDRGAEVVNTRTNKKGIVKDWSDLRPVGVDYPLIVFNVLTDGKIELWPENITALWQGNSSIVSATPFVKKVGGIVFISCGQTTPEERGLGVKIFDLIQNHTPYQPYYADKQTSLRGLTDNIFNQLNKCIGLVVVLQKRDLLSPPSDNAHRGSLFIEQEIAIASFIEQILGRHIEIFLYKEIGVTLEGVRRYLQLNSTVEFNSEQEIIKDLEKKIESGEFKFSPLTEERVISDVQYVNEFLKLKVLRIELFMNSSNDSFKEAYEIFKSLKDAIHVTFGDNERLKFMSQPGIEPKHDPPSPWVSLTRMREYLNGSLIEQFNAKKLDSSFKRTELPQYADAPIVIRVISPQKEFYLIKGKTKRKIFNEELKANGVEREDNPSTLTVSVQELTKYQDE